MSLQSASALGQGLHGGDRLAWVRGPGADTCPDQEALSARIAVLLGEDALGGAGAQRFEAEVERRDGVWAARIYIRNADGRLTATRTLADASSSCDVLASAVALTVSLGIDPHAPMGPSFVPAEHLPNDSRARWEPIGPVSISALFADGIVPGVAPGIGLSAVALHAGRFSLQVGAEYLPEVTVSTDAAGRFAFGATSFSAAGCWDLVETRRLRVAGCGGVTVGVIHALVYDLRPQAASEPWWQGFTAGVRGDLRVVGPLVLTAGFDVVPLTVRARFDVGTETTTVFEQSPVAVVGSLGIGLTIH